MGEYLSSEVPRVAVILVNWNGAEDTLACIASLLRSEVPIWKIYVVDNASSDGSPDRIKEVYPGVKVILADRNLGYAGGFNLARSLALEEGARFLWLLNNDTVVESDTLNMLLEANRKLEPAILTPQIRYKDDPEKVWYAGGYLDWRLKTYHHTDGRLDQPTDGLIPIEWGTGCSLFCTNEVARSVGPMDERYFLYLEDVDWSLRARRMGIPVYCVTKACLYHDLSSSVNRLDPSHVHYYSWRNYYLLVHTHGNLGQRFYAYMDLVSRFIKTAIRIVFFPSYHDDKNYLARTRGLMDFVLGRFGKGSWGEDTERTFQPSQDVIT